jgi:cysteine desulfurase/selenocysteine lyase
MAFPIDHIRSDFPILTQEVYNKALVYLDNGATTQKPRVVTAPSTGEFIT